MSTFFVAKEAPVVLIKTSEKVLFTYLDIILVFPTPASPKRTTLHVVYSSSVSSPIIIQNIFIYIIFIFIFKNILIIFINYFLNYN